MLLRASGRLAAGREIDVDMRGTMRDGVIRRHVTFKPLVHIPGLSNVDGNPTAVLGLPGINEIPWQRPESGVNRMNLVSIRLARVPRPIKKGRGRALRL